MEKKYQAYTQADIFAEKFWIENEEEEKVIVWAESAEDAEEIFEQYLYNRSPLTADQVTEWIESNPIHVVEINEEEELT